MRRNRRPDHRLSLCLIAASLIVIAPACHAHGAFRTLTGTVTDRQKEPLNGANVQVENESTTAIQSYITETNGTFTFKRLCTDTDYRVVATYRDHHSKNKELSHISSNTHPNLKLIIKLK